jgi:membrane fusion protein (multidrug efflux system)
MSRKTKSLFIAIGAILALVALALPKIGSEKNSKNNQVAGNSSEQRIPVRIQAVHPEKLGDKVVTVGTILPNEEVEIRSEISGKIEKIYFKEGSKAGKGEALLKINDAELQAQLLRAQYRQAIAEQQAERQRQLFEKQLASKEEYDTAFNELNIAKAELQLIKAQLAKTDIRVPLEEKETLMIPAEAVIPELKGHKVFIYKKGKAESQGVEIGLRTAERVEITQGLQAGDTLITSAILQLRPGMAVRPVESQ